jgi:hypothetical protein
MKKFEKQFKIIMEEFSNKSEKSDSRYQITISKSEALDDLDNGEEDSVEMGIIFKETNSDLNKLFLIALDSCNIDKSSAYFYMNTDGQLFANQYENKSGDIITDVDDKTFRSDWKNHKIEVYAVTYFISVKKIGISSLSEDEIADLVKSNTSATVDIS